MLNKNNATPQDSQTGFGVNANSYGGRFINKDGTANIERRGIGYFEKISWYHTFIEISRLKFLTIIVGFFIVVNLIFAILYNIIGLENLDGIDPNGTELEKFGKAFFFSAQTFTTVGYGHISPKGFLTSALAAIEALIGLLSFAIATGLFFGRFSKPKAFIKFSQNAIISPYNSGLALMIRLVPFKNTNYSNAEAKVTLGMSVIENGKKHNRFYQLDLEFSRINTLTLSWTLVHPITVKSPLFGITQEELETLDLEIMVFISTFDDLYSTAVGVRTSYTFDEIIFGAKYDIMYSKNKDRNKTILHLEKLDFISKI